jgi:hypothetical protein
MSLCPKGERMFRSLAAAVALLGACSLAQAQSRFLTTPEEAKKFAEAVVAYVAAGNYAAAIKELRPVSVIAAPDFDLFEAQFNSQLANLLRQFGSAEGYEPIRSDRAGARMIREQFMVFHEKSALRWNFIFYKAKKGWVLSHFNFDGNALNFFASGG